MRGVYKQENLSVIRDSYLSSAYLCLSLSANGRRHRLLSKSDEAANELEEARRGVAPLGSVEANAIGLWLKDQTRMEDR